MTAATTTVDWPGWLRRWDAQQEVYIEGRERVFDVMLDVVESLLPAEIVVLDLAAGPGSISERVLRRLPRARCVAVDVDPVLVSVGRGALAGFGDRLRWVQADLRDPDWPAALGPQRFDAVLSTTATHWLDPAALAGAYRRVADLLTPRGILLNGDGMYFPGHQPRIRAVVAGIDERRRQRAVARGAEDWDTWWASLRTEPALADAFAVRDRLFPPRVALPHRSPTRAFHGVALAEAGFAEVASVWQDLHKHIVLALR
ncbi:MAG: class I SAM-dependent methyltransferase [Pseudonocardia sp.]